MLCSSLDERGVWGRMDTCVCTPKSLDCPPETITTLLMAILWYKKFKNNNEWKLIILLYLLFFPPSFSNWRTYSIWFRFRWLHLSHRRWGCSWGLAILYAPVMGSSKDTIFPRICSAGFGRKRSFLSSENKPWEYVLRVAINPLTPYSFQPEDEASA